MGKKNRSSRRREENDNDEDFNNVFSSLDSFNLDLPEMEPPAVAKTTPTVDCAYPDLASTVIKVRLEKKGRGGKTVTVLYGLPDDCDHTLMRFAADLKKQIATGGSYINGNIELQGDIRPALKKWLDKKSLRYKGDL